MANVTKVNPWKYQDQMGYSQAVKVKAGAEVIYVSGQTSTDAEGNALHPGDMGKQIGVAIDNVEIVLKHAGAGLSDIVKMNIYVTDIPAFMAAAADAIGGLVHAGCVPASTLVGVTSLINPALMVEIEAVAII